MVSVAVFDFDDTLLQSEQCKADTIREIVSEYEGGLDALEGVPQDARSVPAGVIVSRHTIFREVASRLHARGVRPGPEDENAEAFGVRMCNRFTELVQRRLSQAAEVPGATSMLEQLKREGVVCYINSATPEEPLARLVESLGWRKYFAGSRGIMGQPRTKLENLETIAELEQVSNRQMIFVGDGRNDCRAAEEFGCYFVGVMHTAETHFVADDAESPFSPYVDCVVKDMHGACDRISQLRSRHPTSGAETESSS